MFPKWMKLQKNNKRYPGTSMYLLQKWKENAVTSLNGHKITAFIVYGITFIFKLGWKGSNSNFKCVAQFGK